MGRAQTSITILKVHIDMIAIYKAYFGGKELQNRSMTINHILVVEGLSLRSIIRDHDISQIFKFKLWCDNQSCVKITKNPKTTDQNKCICVLYHFMIELVKNRDIDYTPTQDMCADLFLSIKHHWRTFERFSLMMLVNHN